MSTTKHKRKRKSSKHKPAIFVSSISEKQILDLSNDMTEGITSGTVAQWRAVALYFRNKLDLAHNHINAIRPSVAAYVAARSILKHAGPEMETWLQRVKS